MLFSRLATVTLHKQERYTAGEEALEPEVLRLWHLFNRIWFLKVHEEEHGQRGQNYLRSRQELRAEALEILAAEGVTIPDLRELQAYYAAQARAV